METAVKANIKQDVPNIFLDKFITVYCKTCKSKYYYFSPHKDTAFFFTADTPTGEKRRKHVKGVVYDGKCEVYYQIDYWVDV